MFKHYLKITSRNLLLLCILTFHGCKKETEMPVFETDTFEDNRDGKIYKTVKIGEQWWMAENLNYYTSTGSWYYDNDSVKNSKTYGRLYLWETVINGQSDYSNKTDIASPSGWHIPSDSEWSQLENYLNDNNLTGIDLKESSNDFWKQGINGNNKTKFTALPAGTGHTDGTVFANINGYTTFLSSTIDTLTNGVWGRGLGFDSNGISRNPLGLNNAWSVRCVKNVN